MAAAAAFSSVGLAAPCFHVPVASNMAPTVSCTANDRLVSARTHVPGEEASAPLSSEAASDRALDIAEILDDDLEAARAGDSEIFSDAGVKITRLEATMTSNKYVADIGTFTPAAELHQTEDITVNGLDYRSVKDLPKLPKKKRPSVVGVGLMTAPSQTVKKTDTAPSPGPTQWFPSLPEDKFGTVNR
jgi:hypothetical protein